MAGGARGISHRSLNLFFVGDGVILRDERVKKW